MNPHLVFGSLMAVLGGLQLLAAFRSRLPNRTDSMLFAAVLVFGGLGQILDPEGEGWQLAFGTLSGGLALAVTFRQRRQSRRLWKVVAGLLAFWILLTTLHLTGVIDRIPESTQRLLAGLIFIPFIAAGLVWALFTVGRAVRAPFKPLPPPDDEAASRR